jgi:hypothetical protein
MLFNLSSQSNENSLERPWTQKPNVVEKLETLNIPSTEETAEKETQQSDIAPCGDETNKLETKCPLMFKKPVFKMPTPINRQNSPNIIKIPTPVIIEPNLETAPEVAPAICNATYPFVTQELIAIDAALQSLREAAAESFANDQRERKKYLELSDQYKRSSTTVLKLRDTLKTRETDSKAKLKNQSNLLEKFKTESKDRITGLEAKIADCEAIISQKMQSDFFSYSHI